MQDTNDSALQHTKPARHGQNQQKEMTQTTETNISLSEISLEKNNKTATIR